MLYKEISNEEFKTVMDTIAITGNSIAVAVSGGADSLCMALLSKNWAKQRKDINITAIVIDHGLRKGSAEEAEKTVSFLKFKGIEAILCKWDKDRNPISNVQHHARQARYNILTNTCIRIKASLLMIGHNKNDQAETVLMRIYRGSGIQGICGMKQKTECNGIKIFRPLLHFTRERIEATLVNNNWVDWQNDPSNYSPKYLRTQIRDIIYSQPDAEIWVNRLTLLSQNIQRSYKYIKNMTEKAKEESVFIDDKMSYAIINNEHFISYDEEIRFRMLTDILMFVGNRVYPPRIRSLISIDNRIRAGGFKGATIMGCEVKIFKNQIFIFRELKDLLSLQDKFSKIWDNKLIIAIKNHPSTHIKPLGPDGWKVVRDEIENIPALKYSKMFHVLPVIYDDKNDMLCIPLLNWYSQKAKDINLIVDVEKL